MCAYLGRIGELCNLMPRPAEERGLAEDAMNLSLAAVHGALESAPLSLSSSSLTSSCAISRPFLSPSAAPVRISVIRVRRTKAVGGSRVTVHIRRGAVCGCADALTVIILTATRGRTNARTNGGCERLGNERGFSPLRLIAHQGRLLAHSKYVSLLRFVTLRNPMTDPHYVLLMKKRIQIENAYRQAEREIKIVEKERHRTGGQLNDTTSLCGGRVDYRRVSGRRGVSISSSRKLHLPVLQKASN